MAFRTEMTIPVNKDPRTFEQRRDDLVSKLERSYSNKKATTSSSNTATSASSTSSSSSNRGDTKLDTFHHDSIWDKEMSDYLENTRKRWNKDITDMRQRMFHLEPMEGMSLDMDNWDPFKGMGSGGDGSQTQSSHSSQSSRTVTTSINGNQTSETSRSSSHTTSGAAGVGRGLIGDGMMSRRDMLGGGSLFDRPIGGSRLQQKERPDFLKDAYEVGEDGQVHFKVRFDAKDFNPENIHVTTQDNRLSVSAKQTTKTNNTTSTREFSRSVDLPNSIEHEKFTCQMTEDGVLILDAPVKAPEYSHITFKDGLGIKPSGGDGAAVGKEIVKITGQQGPIVVPNGANGKKIHVEVPVDAEFAPDDFTIKTETNKIHITGRHEVKTANSSSFKEFSRYYEVPETLDPMSVSANLINGTLVVEAPLAGR